LGKRITWLMAAVAVLLIVGGCAKEAPAPRGVNWSVSKHSDVTDRDYEEVDGYRAAFYDVDEIAIDRIRKWIDSCETTGGYHHYIYSDPDSWDMFIYYLVSEEVQYSGFAFYIADSTVNVYVETDDASPAAEYNQDYVLIRVQAPMRAAWPSSSRLFVDGNEIDLSSEDVAY